MERTRKNIPHTESVAAKKRKMRKYFDEKYNKLNVIEFKAMDEVNREKHLYMPRRIMDRRLSNIELALYPVLCSYADFRESKWFSLSIANMTKLSGMSTKTVQKALNYLTGDILVQGTRRNIVYSDGGEHDDRVVPILERKKVYMGSRRHNEYKVEFFREGYIEANKGGWIMFNTSIVETGIWANLSVAAKALYIRLRMDAEIEVGSGGNDAWQKMWEQGFRNRKYDVVYKSLRAISTNAKIRQNNVKKVIGELEKAGLCMWLDGYCLVGLDSMEHDQYLD